MADYSSGVYVKPLDLFSFQFGGGQMASSNNGVARAKGSSEKEKEDKFDALQTMEQELRNRDLVIDYSKQALSMQAMNEIRSGKAPMEVLNQVYTANLSLLQAKNNNTALANAEKTKKANSIKWNDEVVTKRAEGNYVLQNDGDVMRPVNDPLSKQRLTYGNYFSFANALHLGNNPEEFGRYDVSDENGMPVVDKDQNGNLRQRTAPWTMQLPIIYDNSSFQTNLSSTIKEYASYTNETGSKIENLSKEHIDTLTGMVLTPTTEFSKKTNQPAFTDFVDRIVSRVEADPELRHSAWNQFYQVVDNRGSIIGMVNKTDDKGNLILGKDKKPILEKARISIVDYEKMRSLREQMAQAQKDGNQDAYAKASQAEHTLIKDSFRHYMTARIVQDLNPAIQITTKNSLTYDKIGKIDNGNGGGGKGPYASFTGDVRSGRYKDWNLSIGEKVDLNYKDANGRQVQINEPSSKIIDPQNFSTKSDYEQARRSIFQNQEINAGTWKVPQQKVQDLRSDLWKVFTKEFPKDAQSMIGLATPDRDAAVIKYNNFMADKIDEYLFNTANGTTKELLVPSLKGKYGDNQTISKEDVSSGNYRPWPWKDVSGYQQPFPKYSEIVQDRSPNGLKDNVYLRRMPIIPYFGDEQTKTSAFGAELQSMQNVKIGNNWVNVGSLMKVDGKKPVITNLSYISPEGYDENRNITNISEGKLMLSKNQAKTIMVTIDDKQKPITDLSDDELAKLQINTTTYKLTRETMKSLKPSSEASMHAQGWNDGETVYQVPFAINSDHFVQYDAYHMDEETKMDNLKIDQANRPNSTDGYKVNEDMWKYVHPIK